jgi:predicted esterase
MRHALTLTLLLVGSVAFAQAERYELAARLVAFEKEWDKQTDKDARKRALKDLPQATTQFFSFQLGKAGQTLDDARFALLSDKPQPDAVLWATSLYPEVKLRLTSEKEVPISVKQFYTVKAEKPKGVSIRAGFDGKTWTTVDVEKLPVKLTVPIPDTVKRPADLTLTVEVVVDGKALANRTVMISALSYAMWKQYADDLTRLELSPPLEFASLKARFALVNDLAGGTIPESDVTAAKWVPEVKELFQRLEQQKPYFTPDRPGDHWVSIPTGEKGKTVTPCRLFVPEKLDAKKPVPLVVAMHGAGGSENMFFESYGAGHIVKLCNERGWLLVSPRAGLGFGLGGAPPVGDIIDELAKRYPIDPKRVFVVGHSMGASMTVNAVQQWPGKFAAAACLGGGGSVRKPEAFADLPVFVGVGDKDFAVKTAKGLQTALDKTKAKVTFKEYPDVEHLVIVREALGDVFDLFDKVK